MKYLKLNFRNAGFFTVHRDTKDFIFDLNGQRKRKDVLYGKQQKVSISVGQINGMLHVLMGERPKPTYRDSFIESIDAISNIASQSYIKIDTPSFVNKSKNTKYYQNESVTLRKAVWNSWNPAPDLIYWKRLENLLTNDEDNSMYTQMIELFCKLLGYNVIKKPALDVIDEIRLKFSDNTEFIEFKNSLKGKAPLIKLLEGVYDGSMTSNSRTMLTTNSGIDKITRLSGSIIVPLEDEYVEKIRNSKGTAKLLDGGVVLIEDLIEAYEFGLDELNDYIQINKLEEYENNI
jgi:hypothetical protein